MAKLRRLATHCNFEAYLDQALRDRLVRGLLNDAIQRSLLVEPELTLEKALRIAQSMEAAGKRAKECKVKAPQCQQQKPRKWRDQLYR